MIERVRQMHLKLSFFTLILSMRLILFNKKKPNENLKMTITHQRRLTRVTIRELSEKDKKN